MLVGLLEEPGEHRQEERLGLPRARARRDDYVSPLGDRRDRCAQSLRLVMVQPKRGVCAEDHRGEIGGNLGGHAGRRTGLRYRWSRLVRQHRLDQWLCEDDTIP
jgi:hypothetical protein